MFGERVITTMGSKITPMTPSLGFVVVISSNFVLMLCTLVGIPTSTTQCQVTFSADKKSDCVGLRFVWIVECLRNVLGDGLGWGGHCQGLGGQRLLWRRDWDGEHQLLQDWYWDLFLPRWTSPCSRGSSLPGSSPSSALAESAWLSTQFSGSFLSTRTSRGASAFTMLTNFKYLSTSNLRIVLLSNIYFYICT